MLAHKRASPRSDLQAAQQHRLGYAQSEHLEAKANAWSLSEQQRPIKYSNSCHVTTQSFRVRLNSHVACSHTGFAARNMVRNFNLQTQSQYKESVKQGRISDCVKTSNKQRPFKRFLPQRCRRETSSYAAVQPPSGHNFAIGTAESGQVPFAPMKSTYSGRQAASIPNFSPPTNQLLTKLSIHTHTQLFTKSRRYETYLQGIKPHQSSITCTKLHHVPHHFCDVQHPGRELDAHVRGVPFQVGSCSPCGHRLGGPSYSSLSSCQPI